MPSKLEQLQLQFRQRLKEERMIKIHTDNQQKALSQVSKYSGIHTTTAQSPMAPAIKPQPAITQPQPHHSPIKKGSPGVDRSRPLPPIAKEPPPRNYSYSSSSSPINGSVDHASKVTTSILNSSRSKSVDLEPRYNATSRQYDKVTPRSDQNGRIPPRNEVVQNGRVPTSSRNEPAVQNGKAPMRNGYATAGRSVVNHESKPYPEVSHERKPDQELLNKMKQAELQRLKANSKLRDDPPPRNGFNGTISKSSIEPKKTTKPSAPALTATRSKHRTQVATTTRRPTKPTTSNKSSQQSSSNSAPRKPPGPGQEQCSICGRNFNQDRIEKHISICKKAAQKKVKVFDATKMRTKGTEAEQFVKKGAVAKQETKPSKKSDWRKKHNEFIEAIRQAKLVQQHLASGGKVSDLPPPKPSDNSDYVQCPHCGRKFNEGVAERHIPKCKNILCNKKNPAPARKK